MDIIHQYYESGKLKSSAHKFNNKQHGVTILYFENGQVESLENYINDTINGEVFSFYDNGNLERKSVYKMGVPNGPNYAFYSNGSIKEYRNWINGRKQGYGEDYWNNQGAIKVVYFAYNDTLVYRRFFDSSGNIIKTEGTPPLEPNPKVSP